MPFFRRLFRHHQGRPSPPEQGVAQGVDLVSKPLSNASEPDLPPPPPLGIATDLNLVPWALTRVAGVFRELARRPDEQRLKEARFARHCLSRFWLTAPLDQLENLYGSPIGQLYGLMLESVLASQPLATDEVAWRDGLQTRLFDDFDRPERLNLLLALMPYFPPGKMKVEDALTTLPRWFLVDYARFCEPSLEARLRQPVALLDPGSVQTPITSAGMGNAKIQPAPLQLPVLAEYRGADALTLIERQAFQERMVGLLNLYHLDQQDDQVSAELSRLRRQLGQLWLDLLPDRLETLYRSPVGDLYRQLLASPFTAAPLSEEDQIIRQQLTPLVDDLNRDGAINVLLAVLPFFPGGKVELAGQLELIPPWLREAIQRRRG